MDNIQELLSPCFIINENKLKENIYNFRDALDSTFYKGILGYSVKTNSLPFILKKAKEYGCFAEVVSADEYILAKKVGFPISNIIYNGPMKTRETFIEALENGAYVNIENFREIEWLKQAHLRNDYNLGIRVNINFGVIGLLEEKNYDSRFGFSYENGDVEKALYEIKKYGLRVNGIHAHRTSSTRSLEVYNKAVKYISNIVNDMEVCLKYIDIGGGFFGDMPGKPGYYDYAREIKKELNVGNDNVIVIVEPGNALIASPIDYCFTILDCKKIQKKKICCSDATRLDVDPFFHKTSYWYSIEGDLDDRKEELQQVITGSTCLENDVLMTVKNEKNLMPGDRIIIKCVGAYTMALTPNFINYLPTVYVKKGNKYEIVRKKGTIDNIMMNNEVED